MSAATTDLIFAGTLQTGTAAAPLNQNIGNPMLLNSLTFSNGAGPFFLGGNPLQFEGASNAITQNSANPENIVNGIHAPSGNSTVTLMLGGNGTGMVSLAGAISKGNGQRDYSIVKSGSSTFSLSGSNTYGGGTVINGGALVVNNSASLGAGPLVLNAGTLEVAAGFTTARSITVGDPGSTFQIDPSQTYTISSALGGTGAVNKVGGGTLVLTGANTFSGGTTINSGTVVANTSASLGTTSGGLILNDGTLEISTGFTTSRSISLGSSNSTFQIDPTQTYTVASGIAGAGTLNKSGAGIMVLSGTNTYSGGTLINSGSVIANREASLGATSGALTLNAGTLEIATGFATSRSISLGDISSALKIDPSQTYTVSGSIGGMGSLNKTGTGTLVLAAANTYSGGTIVSGGVVNVQNNSGLGSNSGGTMVALGAALQAQGNITIGNVITLNGTGVSADGALRNISGSNTFTGAITLASSALASSDLGLLTILGNIGETGTGKTIDFGGAGDTTLSGTISSDIAVVKEGSGTLALTGINSYTGGTTINGGTVLIDSATNLGGASLLINAGTLEVSNTFTTSRSITLGSAASTIQVDAGDSYTVTSAIAGAGGLTKNGAGTMVLSGPNTYSGGTTLNAGTVIANSDSSLGALTGSLNLNSGALEVATGFSTSRAVNLASAASTVLVDSAQTYTVTSPITGTGGLTKNGAGSIVLQGTNTYTGATTVNNGTLVAAGSTGAALGLTISVTVNANGTVQLGASNQINNSATLVLAGGTFAKGNFSEGAANAPGVGTLNLTAAGSQLDFGTGTVGTLEFAIFNPGGRTLIVDNWSGAANAVGTVLTDRLVFSSDQGANLGTIKFVGYSGATEFNLGGGYFEVVPLIPVPEMDPAILAAVSCMVVGFIHLRRRASRVILG